MPRRVIMPINCMTNSERKEQRKSKTAQTKRSDNSGDHDKKKEYVTNVTITLDRNLNTPSQIRQEQNSNPD